MSFDLPTAVVATAIVGVGGWVIRMLVFDAIAELRKADIRQGERIGKLEEWQKSHDAVEGYREKRRRIDTRGVPIQPDDETP